MPSVLQYADSKFTEVSGWGYSVHEKHLRKNQKKTTVTVERFKLHLSNMPDSMKPLLPKGLDYKKVITDYLRAMGMYK